MSSDAPPSPPLQPALTPSPGSVPATPMQISCPHCFTEVAAGTQFCPNCGNALPPSWPTIPQPVAVPPKKPRTRLVIAIILLILIVGGVGGYTFYRYALNPSQSPTQTEQAAANNAPNQLRFTCLSVGTDISHLSYSQYGGFQGYAIISETFGLTNPTRFPMRATWTITLDYISLNLVLSATSSFSLAANSGTARPIFPFTITAAQYNGLPANPSFSGKFTVTLSATYSITGTYGTYDSTQHSTYDSSTNSGTGTLASTASVQPCQ